MSGFRGRGPIYDERVILIANPRAAGGRTGDLRDRLERAASRKLRAVEVWWTEGPGHATELATRAVDRADLVVAMGGDGTCHEVVNGLFDAGSPRRPEVVFGVIPSGTGGDLVRTLEIPHALDEALDVLARGLTVNLDVGRMTRAGQAPEMFINVAGFGANAVVCERVNASSKKYGGAPTFLEAIYRTLLDWRPRRARWAWEGPDGSGELEMETFAAFCANGSYCGAGLYVGKGGSMADGVFELSLVPRIGPIEAIDATPRFYLGTFTSLPGVRRVRVSRVELRDDLPVELDGEPQGPGPVVVDVVPGALRVRGGWRVPPALG